MENSPKFCIQHVLTIRHKNRDTSAFGERMIRSQLLMKSFVVKRHPTQQKWSIELIFVSKALLYFLLLLSFVLYTKSHKLPGWDVEIKQESFGERLNDWCISIINDIFKRDDPISLIIKSYIVAFFVPFLAIFVSSHTRTAFTFPDWMKPLIFSKTCSWNLLDYIYKNCWVFYDVVYCLLRIFKLLFILPVLIVWESAITCLERRFVDVDFFQIL